MSTTPSPMKPEAPSPSAFLVPPAPAQEGAPTDKTTDEKKRRPTRRANTAERRATHNAVERMRRETLNGRFLTLASLLPPLAALRRPSKAAIVGTSIATLHAARRHRVLAAQTLRAVAREAEGMRREVNEWRARARIPGLEAPVRTEAHAAVLRAELEDFDLDAELVSDLHDLEEEGDEDDDAPDADAEDRKNQNQGKGRRGRSASSATLPTPSIPPARFAFDLPSPPSPSGSSGSGGSWEAGPRTPPASAGAGAGMFAEPTPAAAMTMALYGQQQQQQLKIQQLLAMQAQQQQHAQPHYDLGLPLFEEDPGMGMGAGLGLGLSGMPAMSGGWASANPQHPAFHHQLQQQQQQQAPRMHGHGHAGLPPLAMGGMMGGMYDLPGSPMAMSAGGMGVGGLFGVQNGQYLHQPARFA
ncbi:hypothetical protein DFH07DRAFT_431449 [Mycena maculata]|uniref:BHLH domain-containing protein n=1 Tax=Mycena maculata TaxID=230809 RepID=A0AAD7JCD7_9AGAR|nr:hypothetical protein DFH07DRAFT_431449 [Mycena maculata]